MNTHLTFILAGRQRDLRWVTTLVRNICISGCKGSYRIYVRREDRVFLGGASILPPLRDRGTVCGNINQNCSAPLREVRNPSLLVKMTGEKFTGLHFTSENF